MNEQYLWPHRKNHVTHFRGRVVGDDAGGAGKVHAELLQQLARGSDGHAPGSRWMNDEERTWGRCGGGGDDDGDDDDDDDDDDDAADGEGGEGV